MNGGFERQLSTGGLALGRELSKMDVADMFYRSSSGESSAAPPAESGNQQASSTTTLVRENSHEAYEALFQGQPQVEDSSVNQLFANSLRSSSSSSGLHMLHDDPVYDRRSVSSGSASSSVGGAAAEAEATVKGGATAPAVASASSATAAGSSNSGSGRRRPRKSRRTSAKSKEPKTSSTASSSSSGSAPQVRKRRRTSAKSSSSSSSSSGGGGGGTLQQRKRRRPSAKSKAASRSQTKSKVKAASRSKVKGGAMTCECGCEQTFNETYFIVYKYFSPDNPRFKNRKKSRHVYEITKSRPPGEKGRRVPVPGCGPIHCLADAVARRTNWDGSQPFQYDYEAPS